MRRSCMYGCVLALLFGVCSMQAQFYSTETRNLRLLYYDTKHESVIPHLRRCFENSFRFHSDIFHYTPSEEVTVFLQDFDDYGYAGATALPFNYMILGIEPYEQLYGTSPTNERLNWVMSHELTHIVTTDKASRTDKFYRSLFSGKVTATSQNPTSMIYSYLTAPRKYSPRWYLEGIAVFMETWMAGGIGRAQGGYDEMVFRTMVADSSFFYDVVGLESEGTTVDFQIGQNSYLYGARFMCYLAYVYGPEKLLAWVDRTEESDRDFASQFSRVYGSSLDDEWSKWIAWEHQWQESNLDSIRQYPLTSYRRILADPVGAVSRSFYDPVRKKLFAAVNVPGQMAHIVAMDVTTGKMENLAEVSTPALYYVCSLAYDQEGGNLFYSTQNGKSWRGLAMVNVETREQKILTENTRAGDLAFNAADKSLWGVRHHNGTSTLVRIPAPYNAVYQVLALPYGRDLFDLDISRDGTSLSGSMMEISGRQKLIRMSVDSLMLGFGFFDSLYEFENNAPMNFVFSPDGRFLYGSTYHTGVSNIVRYDLQRHTMDWLTNGETGFFRPVPLGTDSLIAYRYAGKGFLPVMLADRTTEDVKAISYLGYEISVKYPVVRSWTLPSPLSIDIDSLTTFSGEYEAMKNIKLVSAYPVVEGYKNFPSYGIRLNLMDALLSHDLDLTASFSPNSRLPDDERFHAGLNWKLWQWKFSGSYNRADFYDLFGPSKTSRKGYSLGVQYSNYLLYNLPKQIDYSIGATGWGGLQTLPDYQDVSASFDRLLTADGRLTYRNLTRSLGGVEAEQGVRAQVQASTNYVNERQFPRFSGTLDCGILLPLDHSSVWLRTAGGYSIGDRDEPFANFYFGGFGNNWVDYQGSKRYREYYSFPGIEINTAGGTSFGKVMLEWVLPPLRFRRLGFMNLYCNWAHGSLFVSGLVTNIDSRDLQQRLLNAGAQVDFKLVVFSRLETMLSVGYAGAIEETGRPTREFVASLKIF